MTSFSILDNIEHIQDFFFENIIENGAIFHYTFKYMIFQSHQKMLLWSKGIKYRIQTNKQTMGVTFFVVLYPLENCVDPDQLAF